MKCLNFVHRRTIYDFRISNIRRNTTPNLVIFYKQNDTNEEDIPMKQISMIPEYPLPDEVPPVLFW